MNVNVNIAGDSNVFRVIDQYDLAGQMAALSFIYFKVQFHEIKKAPV